MKDLKNSDFLKEVKLVSFAKKRFCFDDSVHLKQFERLHKILGKQDAIVKLDIFFGFKDERTPIIKGSVSTIVKFDCQRCLDSFDYELKSDISCVFIKKGKEKLGNESSIETFTYQEKINVFEVIEEELLLCLPMIAKHQECEISYKDESLKEFEKIESKINPFAILSKLKEK
jgi:uncharacterized protein